MDLDGTHLPPARMVYRLVGLISPAFFIVFARHTFVNLLQSPLEPQGRVKQMKGIITANLFGNGAYLLALAMVLFGGGTFG